MKMLGKATKPSDPYRGRSSASECFQAACNVPYIHRYRWRMKPRTASGASLSPAAGGYYRDAIERIERPAVQVLAGDVLERLPASQQINSVSDLRIAGHRADSRIREVSDQLADCVPCENGVCIERDDYFGRRMQYSEVQGIRLAGVGFCKDPYSRLIGKRLDATLISLIGRAVINDYNLKVGRVIGRKQRRNCLYDDFLFVEGRNDHRDRRAVGRIIFR